MAIPHCLKIYCTADFVCITNLEIVNLHRPKTSSTSTRIMSVAHTAYTIKNTVVVLASVTCIKRINYYDLCQEHIKRRSMHLTLNRPVEPTLLVMNSILLTYRRTK